MENNDYIILKTDKELKILMSPIRQKIIKIMSREGKPVTSKHLADKLNISPSSAQHHIKQLQQVGIVEFDHNEIINGITAKYLRLSEKTVSIGQDINDDLSSERDVLARSILSKTYNGYKELINEKRQLLAEEYRKGNKFADQLAGVVHLSTEEANELFDIIDDFIKKHSKAYDNSHPYEYALIAYRADLNDDKGRD
ncbi:helix-turn-helix domain-containing protein [Sedimentibacter sp.]|uniref:helix-turn-helix domain-containing protein n=1 Tax=Sedimentibacter sp. TaxID=1960295 RepID=UPI0028AC1DA5|nr:helix-turn-helix domain-containing protein [Sedimentibacter sp.]